MTKYKVPQAVMDDLDTLKDRSDLSSIYGTLSDIKYSKALQEWVYDSGSTLKREQAVIDYAIHHKDNFEVKKPTWVIVSKKASKDGYYISLTKANFVDNLKAWSWGFYESRSKSLDGATRITDPKLKDALLYANKGFEAIEVEI